MNRDVCGFGLSFFMHASILGICVYMLPSLDLQPKPLVIDFSLISESISPNISTVLPEQEKPLKPPRVIQPPPKPIKKVLPKETPKPVIAKKVLTRPAEKILPKKEEKVVIEESFSEVKEIPVAQPQVATTVSDSLIQRNSSLRAAASTGVSKQTMEQHYVKAHFIYIKKIIEKNISYPPMARRMGWQGKVLVSFIVCKDGKVENLQVVESSGHKQLDRNALETVKQVGPFPSPPVRVKLVLPVTYTIS
jgi:protein TonB